MPPDQSGEYWRIVTARAARKDFTRFRSVTPELRAKIAVLRTNPDAGDRLEGALEGALSLKFSLKGMGECRVAYVKLPDNRICLLFLIGPRENFYREALRRFEALQRRENVGIGDEVNDIGDER